MGRKSVSKDQKIVPVVVHTNQFKVDAIGKETLKKTLVSEIDKQYLKTKKK